MRYGVYVLVSRKHDTPCACKVSQTERDDPEWKNLYERIND